MAVKFVSDSTKLNQMVTASLESIAYRQDKYSTGGIVESDDRFDNGFLYGYGKMCYPRVHLVKNLLGFGERERAKKFCRFWLKARLPNGGFQQCHWVDRPNEILGWQASGGETDTNGYILKHWGEYFAETRDREFLTEIVPGVERLVEIITGLYHPKLQLCYGEEEVVLKEPEGEVNTDDHPHPPGYHLHINSVFQQGLSYAAALLLAAGRIETAQKAHSLAEKIKEGILTNLWDKNEGRWLFGLKEDGTPYYGAMWFSLMYPYLNESWDIFADKTFWYLWKRFYNRDPKIAGSYWSNDFYLLLNGKYSRNSKYTGAGPEIGVSAAICQMLLMGGYPDQASQQLELILKYTDESNLICEHINTLSAGSEGRFKLYPEEPYAVDRGNLMHLSFFLNLIRYLIGKRDEFTLIPTTLNNLKELKVAELCFQGIPLSYIYRIGSGIQTLELTTSHPLFLKVGLRCQLPVSKVKVNGREVLNYTVDITFSGKIFYLSLPIKIEKFTKIEVWS